MGVIVDPLLPSVRGAAAAAPFTLRLSLRFGYGGRRLRVARGRFAVHMPRLERITHPMVRDTRGGPLRRASWDEALDRAAAGLAATVRGYGPQAFGLFSCSKSTNEMNYAAQKFARAVIGSNNIDSCNRT
jgi:predicted molibdopterin-dependent oxidoreductase YjgC